MNLKINGFKVSVILPRDILANIGLAGFQAAMVSNLTAPDCPEAKTFMRLVVDEIRIYADEATISGTNLGVLEAVLSQTRNTVPTVPTFVRNWRGERNIQRVKQLKVNAAFSQCLRSALTGPLVAS